LCVDSTMICVTSHVDFILILVYLMQIKKITFEHTRHSTGKVEENSMATNHWVRDRILNWFAKTILH
jgi:hypothetical protein